MIDPFLAQGAFPTAGALQSYSSLQTQSTLMSIGVEPGRIRTCLLESVSGRHRLIGWLGQPRRAGLSVADQAGNLCRELGRRLRRPLWDEVARTPYLRGEQPLRVPPIDHLAVTLSPLPRLRLGILGLTAEQSTQHALEAVAGAPVQVASVWHYTPQTFAQALADEWRAARVDVVLIVGGYDAVPSTPHGALDALLTRAANALQILPLEIRPEIFFAGSVWAGVHAERIFAGIADMVPLVLPNLTPTPTALQPIPIVQSLHALYADRAQQTPGYGELAAWSNSGVASTTLEANFARLVRAWRDLHNLPNLHGVYMMDSGTVRDGSMAGHGDETIHNCRLHVWDSGRESAVQLRYEGMPVGQGARERSDGLYSIELADWPPMQLLCGGFGRGLQLPASLRWWDRGAMAPLVAALGASAPLAVRQVLQSDILTEPSGPTAAQPRAYQSRALQPPRPLPIQPSRSSSRPPAKPIR